MLFLRGVLSPFFCFVCWLLLIYEVPYELMNQKFDDDRPFLLKVSLIYTISDKKIYDLTRL